MIVNIVVDRLVRISNTSYQVVNNLVSWPGINGPPVDHRLVPSTEWTEQFYKRHEIFGDAYMLNLR